MPIVRDPSRAALRPYDFRRPYQLNKLQLEAITVVSEGFCRAVSNLLAGYLHAVQGEVSFLDIAQISYDEFMESTPVPSVLNVFSHPPDSGTALLRFDVNLALSVVDKALGGPGLSLGESRPLTEIEQAVFARFAGRLLGLYAQAWSAASAFSVRIEATEFNPVFTQIVSQGDLVVVSRFSMALDEGARGTFHLVWPYAAIRPMAQALATHGWNRDEEAAPQRRSTAMQQQVLDTPVPMEVVLGYSRLALSEFSRLDVGHVIILDRHHDDPLDVEVGGTVKFQGMVGQHRGQKVVRVLGRMGEARAEDVRGAEAADQEEVGPDGQ